MKDKPRNPVARSPLMKKGGVHEKSRSAERQREKDAAQSELDEWEAETDAFKKAMADLHGCVANGKGRKYASFFEGPDKSIKERTVAEILLRSLQKDDCGYLRIEVSEVDPPDVVVVDTEEKMFGVEVTELVDQEAARKNQKGEKVIRLWDQKSVVEQIQAILNEKDRKEFKGGPYSKRVLIIHTDEPDLAPSEYIPYIRGHIFNTMKQIEEAYLLFSYNGRGEYPYVPLVIEK